MWNSKLRAGAAGLLIALCAGAPGRADALDIAQAPLFISVPVDPNLMFVLDDSGSMQFETIPDAITLYQFGTEQWWNRGVFYVFPMKDASGTPAGVEYDDCVYTDGSTDTCDYWRHETYRGARTHMMPRFDADNRWAAYFRSSHNNPMYYNPKIRYRPWVKADGTDWPNATTTKAYHNPQRTAKGWRNLTVNNTQTACWIRNSADEDSDNEDLCSTSSRTFHPATYFTYNSGSVLAAASYTRVEIKSANAPFAGGPGRSDCATPTACTYAEEIQNFANWYSYHRSRILAAQAGIGRAFDQLPDRMRIGFGTINKASSSVDGDETGTIISGVRSFDSTGRSDFFSRLYGHNMPLAGTPLRQALGDAGEYYSRTDSRGPWSSTPGVEGGTDLSCRQSFTVLMTDGAWNGNSASASGAQDNNDGTAGSAISPPSGSSYTYSPVDPFQDARSDTLADVAMYYWKNDLRTLDNRVPASDLNPAFWQHMVTFGVGLGVSGTIDADDAFAAISDPTKAEEWPDPSVETASEAKLDDLLHASVNGRGGFFSAGDPSTFADGLVNVLRDVVARTGSVTGLTVSSTRLSTDSKIYAAEFSSEDWSGNLRAHDVDDYDVAWSAADRLETMGHAARKIFTWTGSDGAAFTSGLASAVKLGMVSELGLTGSPGEARADDIIAYVRGNQTKEQAAGGSYRDRESLLGDIVNARPNLAGKGNEGWARLPTAQGGGSSGAGSYGHYLDTVKRDQRSCTGLSSCPGSRYDTVYVGANDGMLHAFDASTGNELFAYVPKAVHAGLHALGNPDYSHRYYVDGDTTVADAWFGGKWRSVLVGSLGAGGRGIYALDVTSPQTFSANEVLWEFTSADDPDLGYTFGEPSISRLADGTWVAIFGNGYNSASGRNYLYVLDLADGEVLHKIALGDEDDSGNGLSAPVVSLDATSRTQVGRVYAGDLKGTMWRVDFASDGPSVKYADGLFTDPDDRSITARPTLAASPSGGMMVYFGTGRLIGASDRAVSSPVLERFWALRDRDDAIASNSLSKFAQVTLSNAATTGQRNAAMSGSVDDGWYVNLRVPDSAAGNKGERVLDRAQVFFGRVLFSTYQPVDDPCTPGGVRRLYVLNAMSGSGAFGGVSGSNVGGREIGSGAPIDPPLVITPRTPGEPGDDGFDPDDPADPDDEDSPELPPEGTTGTRSGWCSVVNVPLPGGGFQPLGTICDGRQVWRQVR